MENRNLSFYAKAFGNLKRDHKNGGAPHKPILILSLIDAFERGFINSNQIAISPELIAFFKANWSKYVLSEHDLRFALPFYHMMSETFWKLMPNEGCELWLQSKGSMRSLGNLRVAVKYAEIDDELVEILKSDENRAFLRQVILEKYFPNATFSNNSNEGLAIIENIRKQIVEESNVEYKTKIQFLKSTLDKETFEEEIILRGSLFKREVPKNYAYTCCISGFSIAVPFNSTTLIEACHIEPFSLNYNDTLSNGIALTPTLHTAFDRGLFTISEKYEIIVSQQISESKSPQGLKQYHGKKILLPNDFKHYPNLESIIWHQKNKFEK
jgi:putative restriction endonuclease